LIILSVGMPRAGSGWYYNLTNDLIISAGFQDGRFIRQRYHLTKILTEVNCNIGALTPRRLAMVLIPSILGNTFVIKAHSRLSPAARWLIQHGWMRAAYIYRDPRDAMLSAYENGLKARENNRPNAFSRLVDFETSLKFIQEYATIAESWIGYDLVKSTRFEDFLIHYNDESEKLAKYLGLNVATPSIQQALEKNRPAQAAQGDLRGMHFSKGRTGRFREKYTLEQQSIMNECLKSSLDRLGYEI
jgi:hypothetical protein